MLLVCTFNWKCSLCVISKWFLLFFHAFFIAFVCLLAGFAYSENSSCLFITRVGCKILDLCVGASIWDQIESLVLWFASREIIGCGNSSLRRVHNHSLPLCMHLFFMHVTSFASQWLHSDLGLHFLFTIWPFYFNFLYKTFLLNFLFEIFSLEYKGFIWYFMVKSFSAFHFRLLPMLLLFAQEISHFLLHLTVI